MSTATPEAPKKNRTVLDQHGQSYELTGRIGEGGQGIVCTTNYPNVLVKVARATTEEKRVSWPSKLRALMRPPLEGLPIAHPQALIMTLPLFRVALNPRFTRPFYAVPRTSAARTASG